MWIVYEVTELNDHVKARLDRCDASDCYITEEGNVVLVPGAEPFADQTGLTVLYDLAKESDITTSDLPGAFEDDRATSDLPEREP